MTEVAKFLVGLVKLLTVLLIQVALNPNSASQPPNGEQVNFISERKAGKRKWTPLLSLLPLLRPLPTAAQIIIGDPSSIANAVANALGVAANVSDSVNAADLANLFGNASIAAGQVINYGVLTTEWGRGT